MGGRRGGSFSRVERAGLLAELGVLGCGMARRVRSKCRADVRRLAKCEKEGGDSLETEGRRAGDWEAGASKLREWYSINNWDCAGGWNDGSTVRRRV